MYLSRMWKCFSHTWYVNVYTCIIKFKNNSIMNKQNQKNKGKFITFTNECRYDETVPLSQLKFSKENQEMYGDIRVAHKDHIKALAEDIKMQGLIEPLSVDAETNEIEKGHNRYVALELVGETEIPVVWVRSPKNKFDKKRKMLSSNMRAPQNIAQKFDLVNGLISDYYDLHGSYPSSMATNQFCQQANTSIKSYNDLADLKSKRPDLFDKIKSSEEKMSLDAAIRMMKADEKKVKDNTIHPQFKNFIEKDWVKKVVGSVQLFMNDIVNKESKIGDNTIQPLKGIQQNILSGVVHEVFTKHLAEILSQKTNMNINHLSNQSPFDMELEGYSWNVDVKVTDSKKYWSSSKKIKGYMIFLKANEDYSRWFVAYGATKTKDWTYGMGNSYHYKFDTLFQNKDDFKILMGDITKEKGKLVLHTDAII